MWHHLKGLVGCFVGGGFLVVVVVLLHQWVLVVSCGIFLCGTQASEGAGSVVAVLGLSCSRTCGILVPQLGFKPTSPALQGRFLTTGPPGKPLGALFLYSFAQQEAHNFWSPATCERVSDKQCKNHPWSWQDLTKWKGGGCQWTCAGPFGAYEEPSPTRSHLIPVPALCSRWDMYSHTHFTDKKTETQAG